MQRTGRSGHSQFRVVAQDSRFSPTRGRVVAYLGSYDPHTKEARLDGEKISKYLQNGAQPSDTAARLFKKEGIKLPDWVKVEQSTNKRAVRNPDKRRSTRPAEEKPEAPVESATETPIEPAAEAPAVDAPAEASEPEAPTVEEPATPEAPAEVAKEPAVDTPAQEAPADEAKA